MQTRRLNPHAVDYTPQYRPVFPSPPPIRYFLPHDILHPLPPPPPPPQPLTMQPTVVLVSPNSGFLTPICYSPKKPLPTVPAPALTALGDNNDGIEREVKQNAFLPPRLRNDSGVNMIGVGHGRGRRITRSYTRTGPRRASDGTRKERNAATAVWKPKHDVWSTSIKYPFGNATTVMIRNIPNRMRRSELLKLLEELCREINENIGVDDSCSGLSEFDFVYLPMDFTRHANMGYAFVNFTTAEGAAGLYRAWHSRRWNKYGYCSPKVRDITRAKIQGKEALKTHFRLSVFMCNSDEYLPVELNPPCDGFNISTVIKLNTIGHRVNLTH